MKTINKKSVGYLELTPINLSTPTDNLVWNYNNHIYVRLNGVTYQLDQQGGAVNSVNGKTGTVVLTKSDIGLGNVDNTSDLDKPISTLTQTALNLKADDNAVVKLTGDQAVAGVKTFSSSPIVPTPTTDFQAVTKKYVDDRILKTRSQTSTATLTPNIATATNEYLTAQAESLTIANPTMDIGERIVIWVKDNGTARAITFGSDYKAFEDNPLPDTTTVGKWMQIIIDKVDTNVVFVSHLIEA